MCAIGSRLHGRTLASATITVRMMAYARSSRLKHFFLPPWGSGLPTAQELSAVRKQYVQQTAEVAKLSEQYDAVRASADSAAVELAAARKQLSIAKAEAGLATTDRIDLMKENSHLRQEYTQAMVRQHSWRWRV